jgi:protein SCO1
MFPLYKLPVVCLLGAVVCSAGSSFSSEFDDELPERVKDVGVEQMLDAEIPLDVSFIDDHGFATTFGELLKAGKPILLTLNYSDCPGLCVAQLNGLTAGINQVGSLSMGKDFKMVSLSINPRESSERAARTKARYCGSLEDHHKPEGWSFLTGKESDILKIAKAVGFNYTYDAKHDRYNHGAAAIFISPNGRVVRYLYEVGFTADTLKMALVEAGEGRIGSAFDTLLLLCYHYDANENRYSASAKSMLAVTAGLFVTLGLAISIPFWFARKRGIETIGHAMPASPQSRI